MIETIISGVMSIAGQFINGDGEKAKMEAALRQSIISGNLQILMKQADTNIEQAKNQNIFVSGARPFIMWGLGAGLIYQLILQPFMIGILSAFGIEANFPGLDMTTIMKMLAWMLGIG